MPKVITVKSARKAIPEAGINVGDTYYWWKFRHGGKHVSKTYPKPQQLTQSSYLQTIYDFQDRINALSPSDADDLRSEVDSLKSDLEDLRSEQEEKLDNMPESLRESPSGCLLQERVDALENAINELDSIDLDDAPEEDDSRDELLDEYDGDEEDWEPSVENVGYRHEEKLQEWIDEKLTEIQSVDLGS